MQENGVITHNLIIRPYTIYSNTQHHDFMTFLVTMDAAGEDIAAETWRGWLCHAKKKKQPKICHFTLQDKISDMRLMKFCGRTDMSELMVSEEKFNLVFF